MAFFRERVDPNGEVYFVGPFLEPSETEITLKAGIPTATIAAITPSYSHLPKPERVIFHDPATIVYWDDGVKTVVKCQSCDTFSKETGLMAAMLKRCMGNDNTYNKVLNYWLDKATQDETSN